MKYLLCVVCLLSVGFAFRNPSMSNNANTTAPPGTAGYWWDKIAVDQAGSYQIPIGPRLVMCPWHVGIYPGLQTTQLGITATITNVFTTTNQADLVYGLLDRPFPVWFQTYNGEAFSPTNTLLMIGYGKGKGAPLPDGTGYKMGDISTYAKRWTICTEWQYTPWVEGVSQIWDNGCQCWITISNRMGNIAGWSSSTNDMSAWAISGDSGSPCLVNCGKGANEWVVIGFATGGTDYDFDLKFTATDLFSGRSQFPDHDLISYVNMTGTTPPGECFSVSLQPKPNLVTDERFRFPNHIPEILKLVKPAPR